MDLDSISNHLENNVLRRNSLNSDSAKRDGGPDESSPLLKRRSDLELEGGLEGVEGDAGGQSGEAGERKILKNLKIIKNCLVPSSLLPPPSFLLSPHESLLPPPPSNPPDLNRRQHYLLSKTIFKHKKLPINLQTGLHLLALGLRGRSEDDVESSIGVLGHVA
jgi:hypothetical protein